MQIVFLLEIKKDLDHWVKTGNKSTVKKITQLIRAIQENPFSGIGKPEPLKTRTCRVLVTENRQRTSTRLRSNPG